MTIHLSDLDFGDMPRDERLLIARALVDSVLVKDVAVGLDPVLRAELRARLDDIDSGRVKCIPWPEARKRLWNES